MGKRLRLKFRAGEEVGYGKPPLHTRFKKGQSGNPAGRPKGALNLATVLARTLREKVVVNEDGHRRTISKLDAAVKQIVNKAASGDPKSIQLLLGLTRALNDGPEAPPAPDDPLPEADREVMKSLLKRIQQFGPGEGDET